MVVFNYTGRELSGKIVYYGPALSGKTTHLEHIYGQTPATTRGKMVSMKTKAERTLFFDLLPINKGQIGDFKVRFLLYTVPGQVYYNATRKLVLKGADAIVFVADSQRSQLAANIDSLRNLRTNLLEYGMCLDDLPWVISYNKRDMPDAMPMEELERELNPYGVPSFPSVAVSGEGVFEAFEKVSQMLMQRLEAQLKGDASKSSVGTAMRQAPPAVPAPPAIDPNALREVKEAIQPPSRPAAPVGPGGPRRDSELIIQRGFDSVSQGVQAARETAATATMPAQSAGAAVPAPPANPAARAAAVPPIVVEKSIVLPIAPSDLAGGRRKVRLVLDITIDPQA
jgi:signal recognition particle receptor subunit beta